MFWCGIGSTHHDVQLTRRLQAIRHNEPAMLERLLTCFNEVFTELGACHSVPLPVFVTLEG